MSINAIRKFAGGFFIASALFFAGIWGVLFFVGIPEHMSTMDWVAYSIRYIFSHENPYRIEFILLGLAPVISLGLGCAYFLPISQKKNAASVLFFLSLALMASLLWVGWKSTVCLLPAVIYAGLYRYRLQN